MVCDEVVLVFDGDGFVEWSWGYIFLRGDGEVIFFP